MGDTYIKVNDALPEHRKIVTAGGDAGWLYVCGLAYASRNISDGRIPVGMVPRLSDRRQPDKLAEKLCQVNLWHASGHDCDRCPQPTDDEYVIHDYLQHQRSADDIEAIKRKRAAAGRRGGSNKAANAKQGATAEAEQAASNLLDGCQDDAEANGTPEAEEVLRTSHTEADTGEVLRTSAADAPAPPSAGADAPDLVLISAAEAGPQSSRKPRKSRRKPDRTIADDLADELTNSYWDRYGKTTAKSWIAVRQRVLEALKNGNERDDVAFALDALGQGGKPITENTLSFALSDVRNRRQGRTPPGHPPPTSGPRADVNAKWTKGTVINI